MIREMIRSRLRYTDFRLRRRVRHLRSFQFKFSNSHVSLRLLACPDGEPVPIPGSSPRTCFAWPCSFVLAAIACRSTKLFPSICSLILRGSGAPSGACLVSRLLRKSRTGLRSRFALRRSTRRYQMVGPLCPAGAPKLIRLRSSTRRRDGRFPVSYTHLTLPTNREV